MKDEKRTGSRVKRDAFDLWEELRELRSWIQDYTPTREDALEALLRLLASFHEVVGDKSDMEIVFSSIAFIARTIKNDLKPRGGKS